LSGQRAGAQTFPSSFLISSAPWSHVTSAIAGSTTGGCGGAGIAQFVNARNETRSPLFPAVEPYFHSPRYVRASGSVEATSAGSHATLVTSSKSSSKIHWSHCVAHRRNMPPVALAQYDLPFEELACSM
jgi:hypothetical protein